MIDEQTQEIVAEVLQAVRTNSKTIEQLTPALSIDDGDLIEIGGGRKITFAKLKEVVLAAIDAADIDVQVVDDTGTGTDTMSLAQAILTMSFAIKVAIDTKFDKDSVVQSTGQGTAKVMSQKAVTDLINDCAKLDDERQDITASSLTSDVITLFGKVLSVGADGKLYFDGKQVVTSN